MCTSCRIFKQKKQTEKKKKFFEIVISMPQRCKSGRFLAVEFQKSVMSNNPSQLIGPVSTWCSEPETGVSGQTRPHASQVREGSKTFEVKHLDVQPMRLYWLTQNTICSQQAITNPYESHDNRMSAFH
jgi:hypothetical protein